jgi:hypothetical protein
LAKLLGRFRLAPEAKFPAQHEDALATFRECASSCAIPRRNGNDLGQMECIGGITIHVG